MTNEGVESGLYAHPNLMSRIGIWVHNLDLGTKSDHATSSTPCTTKELQQLMNETSFNPKPFKLHLIRVRWKEANIEERSEAMHTWF